MVKQKKKRAGLPNVKKFNIQGTITTAKKRPHKNTIVNPPGRGKEWPSNMQEREIPDRKKRGLDNSQEGRFLLGFVPVSEITCIILERVLREDTLSLPESSHTLKERETHGQTKGGGTDRGKEDGQ